MSQTAQSRNPNYAQIFYDLLEKNAGVTNLSRDTYDSMFGTFEEQFAKYKGYNTTPFSADLIEVTFAEALISSFTHAILALVSKYGAEEFQNPKYYYALGYGQGLISIGEILFALAPGLSKHGLLAVEILSKSVICKIMDGLSGASLGLGPKEFNLSYLPYAFGQWRACSDFLKEVNRK